MVGLDVGIPTCEAGNRHDFVFVSLHRKWDSAPKEESE